MAAVGQTADRVQKTATQAAQSAANIVPQGGLFWDGRADTLQMQASGPLLDPREMNGGSVEVIAREKLRHAPYARKFAALFGENIFKNANLLVAEATFAVGRYQVEEPSFHSYTSKFDYWLEGKARLGDSRNAGLSFIQRTRKKPTAPAAIIRSPRAMVSLRSSPTPNMKPSLRHAIWSSPIPGTPIISISGFADPFTRHCRPNAVLRHVQDADPAQHRCTPRLLPQWRIPDLAAGDGFLQFPRHESGESLSARR